MILNVLCSLFTRSDALLPKLQYIKIDALDAIEIATDDYDAIILLQGAQLIHFSTKYDTSNWVWVSDKAEYKLGESVRGGIPICWPVFGQFDANPQAVKDSFIDCPFDISQHGYARTQMFELDSFETEITEATNATSFPSAYLVLELKQRDDEACHLGLKVKFAFSQQGFAISLITQNNAEHSVTFSQALHTYLPTDDITQTTVSGFDGIHYSDTLTEGWQTKTQKGDIRFNSEVDRIYHGAPDITLNTPAQTYHLHAKGSQSTVVWNPWVEKAKQVSQFANDDYQRMLCVETANAHLDVVELGAGESHELTLELSRIPL